MILNSPYISGSLTVTGNTNLIGALTVTGSLAGTATSSSFAFTASSAVSAYTAASAVNATTALTASYATSFTVGGTLTAQTLVVQTITSSVDFVTGSTRFGSLLTNTHQFTGSVSITGSLIVNTTGTEFQVTNNGVVMGNLSTDNHTITGSLNITGSVGINAASSFRFNGVGDTSHAVGYDSTVDGAFLRGQNGVRFITGGGSGIERMRISSAGTASFTANTLTSAADAATINLKQNSTTANTGIYLERSGEQKGYYIYMGGSVDSLTFQRNNAGTKGDVMSLTRDGNVGIGTSSPSSILDIRGTGTYDYISISNGSTSGGGGILTRQNATASSWFGNSGGWEGGTSNDTGIGSYAGGIRFYTNGGTEKMRITSGGIVCVAGTSQLGSSTLSAFGSVAARNSGVDASYAEAFTAYYSANNTESNAILTSVSTTAQNSGFRFDVSNGAGSAARTAALTLTRSGAKLLNGASYLNYYEEGTWTPAFAQAGTPSYTTQFGRYTRIGNMVYCTIALRATSISGGSTIQITGLPFTPGDASDTGQRATYNPRLGGHISGLTETTAKFRITGGTTMEGVKGDGDTTFMTAAQFTSGGSVQLTGQFWYYV